MSKTTATLEAPPPAIPVAVSMERIPLDHIARNPAQPRRTFAQGKLEELAESLRTVGQLQPIAVRRADVCDPDDPSRPCHYVIVMGERRWRAAGINHAAHAGPDTIEAKIFDGVSEAQAHEMALVENLDREALNPIEEAEGLRDLREKFGYTQERLAAVAHRTRPRLANILRLLELPESVQDRLRAGELLAGHGEALLRFKEFPALMEALAALAVTHHATQAELEAPLPFAGELEQRELVARIDHDDFEETGLDFDDSRVFKQLKALEFVRVVPAENTYSDDELFALDRDAWRQWLATRREAYAERTAKKVAEAQAEIAATAEEPAPAAPAGEVAAFNPGSTEAAFRAALKTATADQCRELLERTEADLSARRRQMVQSRLEKLAKEIEAAAKKKATALDLGKLGYGTFAYLDELPAAVRKQIPAEKIELGKAEWSNPNHQAGDIVQVTRDVGLVRGIKAAAAAKKNKVARAKLDAALEVMLENVAAIKTVDPADLALIAGYAIHGGAGYGAEFTDEDFAVIGEEATEEIHKLAPVQIIKLTLAHKLRGEWSDARRNADDMPGNLEAYAEGYEKRLEQKQTAAAAAKDPAKAQAKAPAKKTAKPKKKGAKRK